VIVSIRTLPNRFADFGMPLGNATRPYDAFREPSSALVSDAPRVHGILSRIGSSQAPGANRCRQSRQVQHPAESLTNGANLVLRSRAGSSRRRLDQLIVVEPAHNLFPRLQQRLSSNPRAMLVRGHVEDVPVSVGADSIILVSVPEHVDNVRPFLAALHAPRRSGCQGWMSEDYAT
jgi:hypothetical protein